MRHLALAAVVLVASWFSLASAGETADVAQRIDEILYSDLSKEEMLEQLKPYVAVGDAFVRFKDKTGLSPAFCFGGGPGVQHCSISRTGLELVVDPSDNIRIIRRSKRAVAGREYQQMSVSTNWFEWNGYRRGYPD